MFLTDLCVRHVQGKRWRLTKSLVWEGEAELFVIRRGFETDFASIPKPVRWLLDTAGQNSEAAVLHDAAWRESQRPAHLLRIDPADADGMFRRALRETGATALTRGIMWGGVRSESIRRGRYGASGPGKLTKLAQLAGIALLGLVTVAPPSAVAGVGLAFYWVVNWGTALVWRIFERRKFGSGFKPNWPWLPESKSRRSGALPEQFLDVFASDSDEAGAIRDAIDDGSLP